MRLVLPHALQRTVQALLMLPLSAWSQSGEALTLQAGTEPKSVVAVVRHSESNPCGVELQFGDGRAEKRRLEPGEAWTVPHTYSTDGQFTVKAVGTLVVRGLKTAGGCKLDASTTVAVQGNTASLATAPSASPAAAAAPVPAGAQATANPPAADETRDLLVLYHQDASGLRMVSALDGTKRLASPEALQRGYSYCIVMYPQSYAALNSASMPFQTLVQRPLDRIVSTLAGSKPGPARAMDCVQSRGNEVFLQQRPDFLLVQRQALPVLARNPKTLERYESFQTIKVETLERIVAADQARQQQAADNERQRAGQLEELATADSREHVGSLSLRLPGNEGLRYCTLSYKDATGAAVLGYAFKGADILSNSFRAHLKEQRISATVGSRPFHKAYGSVEELYLDLQKNPENCAVYVDFPKQLRMVMKAIERDQGKRRYELNEILPVAGLRDAWAQRSGHADWAASEFASSIDASGDQVKALAGLGVSSKSQFDQAVAEMKSSKYGTGNSAGEVLAYLNDKRAAPKGQTALSVKQDRERQARAAEEQQKAEERKRQADHAREFPYTATLSCGMGGRHMNLVACFSGEHTKTQLELRNGSQYKMYQAWEVGQAGRNTSEGVVIPLRANFALKAQNIHETLLLSLKVQETATGRTLYEKSAGRFGVVAAQD